MDAVVVGEDDAQVAAPDVVRRDAEPARMPRSRTGQAAMPRSVQRRRWRIESLILSAAS